MNFADTQDGARPGAAKSDESFRQSVDALSRFLAARPAAPPIAFEPGPDYPEKQPRRELPVRAPSTILLYFAAAAAVAAGLYVAGRDTAPPAGQPTPTVAIPRPTAGAPPPSSADVLAAIPPTSVSAALAASGPVNEAKTVTSDELLDSQSRADATLTRRSIAELQGTLKDLGFNAGPLDGVVGPMTMEAIRKYQQSRGQPQTGRANIELLTRIRREATRRSD